MQKAPTVGWQLKHYLEHISFTSTAEMFTVKQLRAERICLSRTSNVCPLLHETRTYYTAHYYIDLE